MQLPISSPTSYSGPGPCRSNGWGYTTHRHRGTGFSVWTRRNVMTRPLFFHPSHHIFNLQKLSLHRSPLVKATFIVKGITFSGVAMLDSGCSTCIVPISQLLKEAKKHVTHSDVHIKGINGRITALGELHCNINNGNRDSPIFEDINVLVTTQDTPILIGQNILAHNTLGTYIIDNQNTTVEFRCTFTSGYTVHTAPMILASTSRHGPAYGALTSHNANQPTIGPQPNIQTLDQKVNWLKQSVGISLPNHPNRDELDATADLLIRYADIIGTENSIKGTFIRAVRIPTNGQSRAPKQHTIAQALEADIDAEIKRMATEGIIESYTNSRGFNSSVFAVHKKNGLVSVVANCKRTLSKVLFDLDPYPMPQIDHLFNRIGEGNKYFASLNPRSGSWQIEIDEWDHHKTAFTWRDWCYQYTHLAFGLTSAGQIFSRSIAEALATVESRDNILSYIDNNLVHAKTFNKYILALEQLFIAFRKFGLKLNPDKCTSLTSEAKFLGRIVNSKGFKADPEYVRAIREMKPPTSKKELQSLIGRLLWIRQFLETRLHEQIRYMFSSLMSPIHELNKVNKPFAWIERADNAFEKNQEATLFTTCHLLSGFFAAVHIHHWR